jgi:hypothetical protein
MNKYIFIFLYFLSTQVMAQEHFNWKLLWSSATPISKVEASFQKVMEEHEKESLKPHLQTKLLEKSHCDSKEVWVFNCEIKKKFLSLCASKDISESSGYLQYSYGSINNPELVYPEEKILAKGRFKSSMTSYSGGGEYRVEFSRSGYKYIIFSKTMKEEWRIDQSISSYNSSGVHVVKNNRVITTLKCETKDSNHSEWNINLKPIIPETEFVYYE